MERRLNYDVHGLARIQITSHNKPLIRGLNEIFSFFETDTPLKPDIELKIEKFSPNKLNCAVIDHKYYIRQDYMYCEDSSGPARWRVEISGLEKTPMEINFYGNIFNILQIISPDFLAQDLILYPCLELSLGFKGMFLAHGSAVVKDEECCVFLGRRGTLKTSLALGAFRAGFKILSEERVILDTGRGLALGFPINFQMFENLISLGVDEYLDFWKKIVLMSRLFYKRQPSRRVWENKPMKVRALCFLHRIPTNGREAEIKPLETSVAVSKLSANNRAEMHVSDIPSVRRNFGEYLDAYSFVFPNSKISEYWKTMENQLLSFVKGKKVYDIVLPKRGTNAESLLAKILG